MIPINLVIPMAGGGTRFKNFGINMPKPLIKIQDRSFFFYATESIRKFCNIHKLIFIVLQEHEDNFQISNEITAIYPQAKIVIIPQLLNGPVLTCLSAEKIIDDDYPVIFNDCDHCFGSRELSEFLKKKHEDIDGALLTFTSNNPAYSYCKIENNLVTQTVEKKVVSDHAICGAYLFKNMKFFKQNAEFYFKECSYKEFFLSGVLNSAIERGGKFITIKTDFHISFGTPEEFNTCKESSIFNFFK